MVLRDDILEEDKEEDEDTKDTDDDEEEDVAPLQSADPGSNGSSIMQIASSIKSPIMPAVPNNSFATDKQQVKNSAAGLYSALEALSSSNNAKQLNSLITSSKKN